jgi:hypothetical protein
MLNIIIVKQSTTTKMESYDSKNGRFVIKSMEIEDHGNATINNG